MSIYEIQKAIRNLSPEELASLRQSLDEYYAEVWGRQIEADAKSGRLDKLIAETDEKHNAS